MPAHSEFYDPPRAGAPASIGARHASARQLHALVRRRALRDDDPWAYQALEEGKDHPNERHGN
jgi:hypothetical protein